MLTTMLDWLNSTALTIGGTPTSMAEVLGFITGVACVVLVVYQNPLNWPVGIINNIMWFILFLTFGLYADGFLQLVYVGLAIFGWIVWVKKRPETSTGVLEISRMTKPYALKVLTGIAVGTAILYFVLTVFTDSTVPFFDAITTALSLGAVYTQAKKKLEAWWLWIVADLIYIPLYAHKSLLLTAVCYIIFLSLCIYGLYTWNKMYKAQTQPSFKEVLI